jgi:hypothetical protein
MKANIDSLDVILAVENIDFNNCHLVVQLLLQEKPQVAYAVLEELKSQIEDQR